MVPVSRGAPSSPAPAAASAMRVFGVGSAQVFIAALEAAGANPTREGLVRAVANIKNLHTDVYPGPITCSLADHRCNKNPAWLAKAPGGPVSRSAS